MNEITQHRPAYFEGFDTEVVKFQTTEELLAIPFVKNFKEVYDNRFFQYSIDPGGNFSRSLLICEVDSGKQWWVVGYLETTDGIDLPKWVPVREDSKNGQVGEPNPQSH
jgi:hypothetical protein